MRRVLWVAAVVVTLVAASGLGACKQGAGTAAVKLDGSPRFPDDQGIVTAVSARQLTLDGRRTYKLSPHLQSFAAVSLATLPVLQTKGQYVHVGLHSTTVTWLGRLADVIHTDHDAVFYVGHLVRLQDRDLVMRDGTVLRLAQDVAAPQRVGVDVTVEIDPARHAVVKIT